MRFATPTEYFHCNNIMAGAIRDSAAFPAGGFAAGRRRRLEPPPRLAFFLLLLASWGSVAQGGVLIEYYSNSNSSLIFNETIQAPRNEKFGSVFETFSAPLVLVNATALEKQGAVVMTYTESGWSWERIVRREMAFGVIAVIVVSRGYTEFPGGTDFIFDGSDVSDVKIPVVEIIRRRADAVTSRVVANHSAVVTISCCDENPWAVWNRSGWMIGFSVILGALSTFVFGFALLKLAMSIKIRGRKAFGVGTLTLSFVLVNNFLKAIIMVIDPIETRKVFPNPWENIFITITFPLSTLASLAITFYWLEILKMNKKVVVSPFLSRLFWPFVICGILVFGFEFGTSYASFFPRICSIFLIGLRLLLFFPHSFVCGLLWWTGFNVLRQLQPHDGVAPSKKTMRLIKATRIIMLGGIGLALFAIGSIISGVTDVFQHPVSYSAFFFCGYMFLLWSDFCKVWAFKIPSAKHSF